MLENLPEYLSAKLRKYINKISLHTTYNDNYVQLKVNNVLGKGIYVQ